MMIQETLTSSTTLLWVTRSSHEGAAVSVGSDRALMTEERVDRPSTELIWVDSA